MFIAIISVLLIVAVKCDNLVVTANFTSTIEETLNPSSVNPHDPVCVATGYFSHQSALQNNSVCLSYLSRSYSFGFAPYVPPSTGNVDFVVALNCTEKNCFTSRNDRQYCQFVSSCTTFGTTTGDMGVEISQGPQNLRFVRNKTVTLSMYLPHYTVNFDLTWQLAPPFAACEANITNSVNCYYNFCSKRSLMQNCIAMSDRCAEFDALIAQFDSTCPGKKCICTPDIGNTSTTCQPYLSTSCRDLTQSEHCATLDCAACRTDNATCKWCNRGGDRACVAAIKKCPSLHAGGDDTIQCGSEPPATPSPSDPIDIFCAPFDCDECSKQPNCKFCTSNGDWRCVGINGTCPSGVFEPPNKLEGVCALKCINNCAGHGTCTRELQKFVFGRPQCTCDPVDGWESDAVAGCRPWANRTACTEKVLNATATCKSESVTRRSKTPICSNAQITIDCMTRADALSCTAGQNTMSQVCRNNSVTTITYSAGMYVNSSIPCTCSDADAGFAEFCRERECTQEHTDGGAVRFCQCVREHIACLSGHFRALATKCNVSDPIGGSYAAICPDLCSVLPLYTAAPLPPPPTPAAVSTAISLTVSAGLIVAVAIMVLSISI